MTQKVPFYDGVEDIIPHARDSKLYPPHPKIVSYRGEFYIATEASQFICLCCESADVYRRHHHYRTDLTKTMGIESPHLLLRRHRSNSPSRIGKNLLKVFAEAISLPRSLDIGSIACSRH